MIRDVVYSFADSLNTGYENIIPVTKRFVRILIGIDLAWYFLKTMFNGWQIWALFSKLFALAMMIFIFNNFAGLSFRFKNGIIGITNKISGTNHSINYMNNPDRIFIDGYKYMMAPYFKEQAEHAVEEDASFFKKIGSQFDVTGVAVNFANIIVMGITIIFITIQACLGTITFHLTVVLGYCLYSFSFLKATEFIGSKVINAVVGQAIAVGAINIITNLVMKFIVSGKINIPTGDEFSWALFFQALVIIFLLLYFSKQAITIAQSLLSGQPGLNAGGLVSTMLSTVNTIANTVSAVVKAPQKGKEAINTAKESGKAIADGARGMYKTAVSMGRTADGVIGAGARQAMRAKGVVASKIQQSEASRLKSELNSFNVKNRGR